MQVKFVYFLCMVGLGDEYFKNFIKCFFFEYDKGVGDNVINRKIEQKCGVLKYRKILDIYVWS